MRAPIVKSSVSAASPPCQLVIGTTELPVYNRFGALIVIVISAMIVVTDARKIETSLLKIPPSIN
jgi:hypothetical protein